MNTDEMVDPEKEKGWEVLQSEYLSREPWFTVRRERIRLPNGNVIPCYYVLEYPEWVSVIAITRDGRFVLVRQYRHGSGHTAYELAAGVCEKEDTSFLESARRELLEETGYGNGNWEEFMTVSANPGTHTNMLHCFLATDVELVSEQELDPTEDLTAHLLSEEEVKKLLSEDRIEQAMHAAPLWKYFATRHLL